jgi:hypothetical protein
MAIASERPVNTGGTASDPWRVAAIKIAKRKFMRGKVENSGPSVACQVQGASGPFRITRTNEHIMNIDTNEGKMAKLIMNLFEISKRDP